MGESPYVSLVDMELSVLPSEKHACLPGPVSLVEVLPLIQLQCLMLQTFFAVYLFIHGHIVPVDTLRCTSRRGVRESAGVGSGVLHCPPIRGPPLRAG